MCVCVNEWAFVLHIRRLENCAVYVLELENGSHCKRTSAGMMSFSLLMMFSIYLHTYSFLLELISEMKRISLFFPLLACVCVCVSFRVLRADGVCESVLYGLPLVIRPTTCWQLDWDEMENNQNLFHALCHTLRV